ncbi:fibronectin type III domain protein [Candidatus Vecturithrix granuli]|uniref:Fibronectin type III domain protein n=1 Tax=Vecturithrix granuli TaxID=1499967 RepID=A0A081BXZ0_VECG1|nr:fibronectin type III domain protein [Candidatus Vecturithrix granuli]
MKTLRIILRHLRSLTLIFNNPAELEPTGNRRITGSMGMKKIGPQHHIAFIVISILILSVFTKGVFADQLMLDLPFQEIDISIDAEGYATFSGEQIQYLSQTGEPAIPYYSMHILLPPDTDLSTVSIVLTGEVFNDLSGEWNVRPIPPMATWDGEKTIVVWPPDKTIVDGRDTTIYTRNAFFPESLLVASHPGAMRKWRLAEAPIALFRYNPITKKLSRLMSAQVQVQFEHLASLSSNMASELDTLDVIGEKRVQQIAVNFETMAPAYHEFVHEETLPQTGERYVIITTNAIVSGSTQLNNFVASKQQRGFMVSVVTESTWGGGTGNTAAENIRNWLRSQYLALQIKYVLLIGNPHPTSGDVPMKMLWPIHDTTPALEAPSDYYYADLTGNWDIDGDGYYGEWGDDFTSGGVDRNYEVIVGRIPYYGNMTDLDNIFAKIIAYSNETSAQAAWRKRVLLPMEPSDANTPGYHLGEAIKNAVVVPKTWNYHRVYDDNYGLTPVPETVPCTTDNVTTAWNNSDFGAIFWWTHGSSTGASGIMDLTHAATLDNSHPGFTFQCSCSNSYPEAANNLTYSLLKNGGIGTVGATRVSWYSIGQTSFAGSATNSGMTYEYSKRLITDEMNSGDALHDLKQLLNPNGNSLWMNFTVFCLYGDPAIGLFSTQPTVLQPPSYVSASDGSYTWGVYIYWPSVTGASYYQVYRNTTNSTTGATALGSWQTNTSYSDSSATPGVTYYYWVKAATSSGGASASNFSSSDAGWRALSVPTSISATDGTYPKYVFISWTSVTGASYYQVYRNMTNSTTGATALGSWQTNTYYYDYSATPGVTYYYWVKAAVDSAGNRPSSYSSYDTGYAAQTYLLNVTKIGSGSGSVTSNPSGISCGSDCTENYPSGTGVTLTATPATGSTFTGWSGACSGTGVCTVSMTAARSVTATFTLNSYTLSVSKAGTGSGTVTSSPAGISCGADCTETYAYNTVVILTATPATGSTFTGWSGACSGTGTCTVSMTAARSVTATFTLNSYTLSVSKAGTGSGTVTSSPAGISCGSDCTENYPSGTGVTLTATPSAGSTFSGWSGGCNGGPGPCSMTMNTGYNVTATFTLNSDLFTDITPLSLPGVSCRAIAWGDYDNDGHVDLLLTGESVSGAIANIYHNNGDGTFTDIQAGLLTVKDSATAWGDYNNDGYLDLVLTGYSSTLRYVSNIYRNNQDGTFTDINAGLTGVSGSSTEWGDYDNDGDLDLLLTGYASSTEWVSRIYRNNGDETFTSINTGMIGVLNGSSNWGDYDGDGDLDILLTGGSLTSGAIAQIYRNDGPAAGSDWTFTGINIVAPPESGVAASASAWGDYDHDGDLDLVVLGGTDNQGFFITRIYRNDQGAFTDINAGLPPIKYGAAAWGDVDNDGDLDLLLTGWAWLPELGALQPIARVYWNTNGAFTDLQAGLVGVRDSAATWVDYDNDADLDVLFTGNTTDGIRVTKLYRNNSTMKNTVPVAPANLTTSVSGNTVVLSWTPATDGQTPQHGLTYNLRIGTTPGGSEICSPMSNLTNGDRRVVQFGNMNHNTSWTIKNLPAGTYYSSVQAIDTAFAGSPFASEQTFTISQPTESYILWTR